MIALFTAAGARVCPTQATHATGAVLSLAALKLLAVVLPRGFLLAESLGPIPQAAL